MAYSPCLQESWKARPDTPANGHKPLFLVLHTSPNNACSGMMQQRALIAKNICSSGVPRERERRRDKSSLWALASRTASSDQCRQLYIPSCPLLVGPDGILPRRSQSRRLFAGTSINALTSSVVIVFSKTFAKFAVLVLQRLDAVFTAFIFLLRVGVAPSSQPELLLRASSTSKMRVRSIARRYDVRPRLSSASVRAAACVHMSIG